MTTFLYIIFLILGLILISVGADKFIDAAVWIAKKIKVPVVLIGATIVSIGTTLPEILVSTTSSIKGLMNSELANSFNSIAVGNALGSMICDTALILGLSMFFLPSKIDNKSFKSKAFFLIIISLILLVFGLTGQAINLFEAIALLLLFITFMIFNIYEALHTNEDPNVNVKNLKTWEAIIYLIIGAVFIAIGADLLVDNARNLALRIGISDAVIGVTIVAIGTSLPELMTTIISIKKKNAQLGIGNIIGANILNATLILGLVGTISKGTLQLDWLSLHVSIFVMLFTNLIAFIPSIIKGKTYRWQGVLVLISYFAFLIYNIIYVL